jgi:RNA polymerase sigma-70 factor, ECF subfamily
MGTTTGLTDAFYAALHAGPGAGGSGSRGAQEPEELALGPILRQLLTLCERTWPGLAVKEEDFIGDVAAAVRNSEGSPAASLRDVKVSDLYLARACAAGDRAALAAFESHFLSDVRRHVRSVHTAARFVDDAVQRVREELFVARDGKPCKIAGYTGFGTLAGWIRVVAIRTALNMRRALWAPISLDGEDAPSEVAATAPDPELDYLKARYRREFREAFAAALKLLSPQQRNALRIHHLDGMSLDETAAACRASRATVARWLAQARRQIIDDTHRLLGERLRLDAAEVDSVLRLVRSQLDISIHRYLAEDSAPSAPR